MCVYVCVCVCVCVREREREREGEREREIYGFTDDFIHLGHCPSFSDIFVHYYRYKRHTDNDLICPLCRVAQETQLHFVLCCLVLRTLRAQFILSKFYKFSNLFRLSLLLASTNENIV